MTGSASRGLISCIVPTFDSATYLPAALETILGQTDRRTEIIVVDDGSTDHTPEVLRRFADRVRAVRQANRGVAAARNRGLELASGDFVAFLDADDLWYPETLERLRSRFLVRGALDICVGHFRNFWEPELAAEERRFRGHPMAGPTPGYATPVLLARRSAFRRVGAFDERLRVGETSEWFMRAARKGVRIELIPDVLLLRRLHPGNTTRREPAAGQEAFFGFVKARIAESRRKGREGPSSFDLPGLGRRATPAAEE